MRLFDLLKQTWKLVAFIALTATIDSVAQCAPRHDVEILYPLLSERGEIHVKFSKVDGDFSFKLFAIRNSEIILVTEKSLLRGNEQVTFSDLPSGLYYLIAKSSQCEFSIGGVEGLIINEPSEER